MVTKSPVRLKSQSSRAATPSKTSKLTTSKTLHRLVTGKRGGGELQLRQKFGFSRPVFARLIPISERSLAEIEKGNIANEAVNRSLAQLQRLFKAMEEVIDTASIGSWLMAPNPAFDGLKPMEVIERGEVDRIWQMIYQLRSGTAF